MKIQTSNFGLIDVEQEAIFTFSEGLPGFSKLRTFCLMESMSDHLFMWLQSVEDPRIAFPVIEPQICVPTYKIPCGQKELDLLGVTDVKQVKVFSIVTIPDNPKDMTVNLRAPVLIGLTSNKAIQAISTDSTYPVRFPVFNTLHRLVSMVKTEEVRGAQTNADPKSQGFQIFRLRESQA